MIQIDNPRTNLGKFIDVKRFSDDDIKKMFKIYLNAGYKIKYIGSKDEE